MKLVNLKAIPIAYERNVYSLNKEELDVIKKTKYRNPKQEVSGFSGFSISETVSLLEKQTLASLKKFMVKKAEEYALTVLEIKDQIYLTQSWSTINNTDAFHETHNHPNTFISVIYYAQCKGGSLDFRLNTSSIKEGFNFHYTIKRFNIYNSHNWALPVQTGDIILFPGHINHGTSPNKSSEPRIIVGANFFIKGRLGSNKDVSLLTL